MLKYLLEKEFKQFFRNPFLPKLIVFFPVMIMLIIPWIANMDIKNINVSVVNHDSSSASEDLIHVIESSNYFILGKVTADYDEAMTLLEFGETDAIIEIPAEFEKNLLTTGSSPVQISINAVNETKGALGSNYLTAICMDFSSDFFEKHNMAAAGNINVVSTFNMPKLNVSVQNRYNPYMDYKLFMIPALMVIIVILMGGFLPALNIVGEKEKGTIEQINISPVPKFIFIIAKLIPYWVIGLLVLFLTMLVGYWVYGLWPENGFWTVCLFAVLFIFAVSGFGLIVSNYAKTMQQASFIMFFFILVFMLMSGLLTPLHCMPEWAQYITIINPPRYFIEMMRVVYIKGGTLHDLWPQFFAHVFFAVFFALWAVLSYKKRD